MVPPYMTNGKIKEALLSVARAMSPHVIRGVEPRVNTMGITMIPALRDFVGMNLPIFIDSNVGGDPSMFLDVVYKLLSSIGLSSREKADLASYQLRAVAQIWNTQLKNN